MAAAIEARKLTKMFGDHIAVEDLSLEIQLGETVGFLGPNGSGKTTTVRMLSGMIRPTKGSAVVAGLRPDKDADRLHEIIGLLTESPGFYEGLSAERNLLFFARFYPDLNAQEQVSRYLKAMGLWYRRHHKVGGFSTGMKQRLALARALLHEPDVLFLDEPTAGLGPEATADVRNLIQALKDKGKTILLCTNNMEEAELLCDRIAVFRTRLVALEKPADLHRSLFHPWVIVELETENEGEEISGAIKSLPFVQDISTAGRLIEVEMTDAQVNRPALIEAVVNAGGRINSVYTKKHSLEQVYLALLQEQDGDIIYE